METKVRSILDAKALEYAATLLLQHQVIAAPTDTVYGVMCRADSPDAIAQLYAIKKRPLDKAIPVLVGAVDQLDQVVDPPLHPVARALMERFWPGPLTVVVQARAGLPTILTADHPTVGVRMPDHDELRKLICAVGPLAATSANLSSQPECHDAEAVLEQLGGRLPLLLAGASPPHDLSGRMAASTVIDVSQIETNGPQLLRDGPLASEVRLFLDRSFGYTC
ncbi:MAG: threonylcarbamoyl-AMP synthase [Caldilineaceae bacterium]|nr:threonylcarbamoyl-AMP synthase [Caldilineaceae bacterium]